MKIRALTLGFPLEYNAYNPKVLVNLLTKIQKVKSNFQQNGIEVQYIRLCTPACTETLSEPKTCNIDTFLENVKNVGISLEDMIKKGILGIYSLIPSLCDQIHPLNEGQKRILNYMPQLFQQLPNMFSSIQVATTKNGFNFQAIQNAGDVVQKCARPDPFTNLRLAVTFNVPPNTPFFPSAYHSGEHPKLSIALEAADVLVELTQHAKQERQSLFELKQAIIAKFTEIYDSISKGIQPFCEQNHVIFEGIDFSPAQYPTVEKSIGTALENLSLGQYGDYGTTFGVGFLTDAIQSVPRPHIGFSGFMQPLLEDYTIGLRNQEGNLDLSKLMLYSTMCGLGLDCIPLSGDLDQNTLYLLLMDLAMISLRLKKPLTARLMPIPDKKVGDITDFNFEFFINSRICELKPVKPAKKGDIKSFLQRNINYSLNSDYCK